jgi:hypothetical protein
MNSIENILFSQNLKFKGISSEMNISLSELNFNSKLKLRKNKNKHILDNLMNKKFEEWRASQLINLENLDIDPIYKDYKINDIVIKIKLLKKYL